MGRHRFGHPVLALALAAQLIGTVAASRPAGGLGPRTTCPVLGTAAAGPRATRKSGERKVALLGDCPAPTVSAIGSRYLSITPAGGANPVALLLTGDGGDADVGCVSLYVQSDGALGDPAVRRTPTEWGTVYVTGTRIRPDTTYRVQTVCVFGPGPDIRSTAVIVRTWPWGDVNNNGTTDIYDFALVLDALDGNFPDGAILENFDVSPCLPDGVIDEADIAGVQAAMNGNPFPCEAPCPAGPNLETYAEFEACLDGPAVEVIGGCESFDGDESGAVDLADFADFQRAFVGP